MAAYQEFCVDMPDGIPHLVDMDRGERCAQHAKERDRWNDYNSERGRRKKPLPPLPWKPRHLEPDRKAAALAALTTENGLTALAAAADVKQQADKIASATKGMPEDVAAHFTNIAEKLDNAAEMITTLAIMLGVHPYVARPLGDDERPC